MTLPKIPSIMHLTEEYIDKGIKEDALSCPVALLLNDVIEGDWFTYTGPSFSYIFPSRENAIKFNEDMNTWDYNDGMDSVAQLGHRLFHEDRLRIGLVF